MRTIAMLVVIVLALGFGVAPGPATAVSCSGHESVSGGPGHAPPARHAGTSHGTGREAAGAAADPAGDAGGPHHHQTVPKGPFCCHAASAAVLVSPPEIASHPGSTGITVASWPHPPAVPADGIYRPPASA